MMRVFLARYFLSIKDVKVPQKNDKTWSKLSGEENMHVPGATAQYYCFLIIIILCATFQDAIPDLWLQISLYAFLVRQDILSELLNFIFKNFIVKFYFPELSRTLDRNRTDQ